MSLEVKRENPDLILANLPLNYSAKGTKITICKCVRKSFIKYFAHRYKLLLKISEGMTFAANFQAYFKKDA
jgi:hypothetical protein